MLAAPAGAAAACPASSPYSQAVAGTSGLASYWRLGDGTGTVACDVTGTNPGSYQPGTTLGRPGAIAGDSDTAVGFNGSSGSVSAPASSSLNLGNTFTIEAWVKRADSNTGSNEVIVSKQDGDWVLMFNGSDHLTLRRSIVADVASSTATITDTQWHYVVATKSGPNVHLYIDGADVTGPISDQTMVDNSQPLAIGQSTGTAYFNGDIDEVALYNTVLTPTQIANHYSLAQPAPPANDFSIHANPSSLALDSGASGSSAISTAVTGGSVQSVSLSAAGVPPGATVSFSPTSMTAGGSATMTVDAGTAPAGDYPITVTGTGPSATHSTTVALTVTSTSASGITNGGFETGSLIGWNASGAASSVVSSGCHGGTDCARVGSTSPTNGDSNIAQTFTAPSGAATLSLWYKVSCPDTVTYDWAIATLRDNTAATTTTLVPKACTNSGSWVQASGR